MADPEQDSQHVDPLAKPCGSAGPSPSPALQAAALPAAPENLMAAALPEVPKRSDEDAILVDTSSEHSDSSVSLTSVDSSDVDQAPHATHVMV